MLTPLLSKLLLAAMENIMLRIFFRYKFWTCCNKRTSDFNEFLKQSGCEVGKCVWMKPSEVSFVQNRLPIALTCKRFCFFSMNKEMSINARLLSLFSSYVICFYNTGEVNASLKYNSLLFVLLLLI